MCVRERERQGYIQKVKMYMGDRTKMVPYWHIPHFQKDLAVLCANFQQRVKVSCFRWDPQCIKIVWLELFGLPWATETRQFNTFQATEGNLLVRKATLAFACFYSIYSRFYSTQHSGFPTPTWISWWISNPRKLEKSIWNDSTAQTWKMLGRMYIPQYQNCT